MANKTKQKLRKTSFRRDRDGMESLVDNLHLPIKVMRN